MKILVVADKNGVGHVKPFQKTEAHGGEKFWIAGKAFNVTADNRIKLGKKFMEEHGYLRADGRRALVLDTGGRHYTENELSAEQINALGAKEANGKYKVQGAKIRSGKPYESYYDKKNGSRLPADLGTGDESLDSETLEAFDSRDIYHGK